MGRERALHALHRPGEVHRTRPRCLELGRGRVEGRLALRGRAPVRARLPSGQRHLEGRRNANGGPAADDQFLMAFATGGESS